MERRASLFSALQLSSIKGILWQMDETTLFAACLTHEVHA